MSELGLPIFELNGRRVQVPERLVEIRLGRGRRERGEFYIPVHVRIKRWAFLRWFLRTAYEIAPNRWSPALWARVLRECVRLMVSR